MSRNKYLRQRSKVRFGIIDYIVATCWLFFGTAPLTVGASESSSADKLVVTEADIPILKNGVSPDLFSKTGRLEIVDAETVKIWITTIRPNVPLKYHRHITGRLIIPLQDMKLTKNYDPKSGKPAEVMVWKRGKTYWYDADEVGVYHNDENREKSPLQVMVVAFRKKKSEPVAEDMAGQ